MKATLTFWPETVKDFYARSDLRHIEETWLGKQGYPYQSQGLGHCRRQGALQFAG
jgi:hypothetical protein